jgi:hypothetical protein
LSTRRTVSTQTLVTIFRFVSSAASSRSVHRVRPAGAAEQQIATTRASACPSNFAGVAGVARGFRSNAGASPSTTNRFRIRSTVFTCMASCSATSVRDRGPPGRFRSLSNRTWACRIFFAGDRPFRVMSSSRARWTSSNTTGYWFGVDRAITGLLARVSYVLRCPIPRPTGLG